jgi:hypothetical protein
VVLVRTGASKELIAAIFRVKDSEFPWLAARMDLTADRLRASCNDIGLTHRHYNGEIVARGFLPRPS